jgi:hypothetical protein
VRTVEQRASRGWIIVGLVFVVLGAGLLWIGLDGLLGMLHDAQARPQCSTPGNPDCLPIAGEDTGYRDAALAGALVLGGGGLALGRVRRAVAR